MRKLLHLGWCVALSASIAACSRSGKDALPMRPLDSDPDAAEGTGGLADDPDVEVGPNENTELDGDIDAAVVAPSVGPLCDGSDALRLELSTTYTSEWGPSALDLFNTHGLGNAFAFVDGHCRFVAGRGALDGIHRGELDSEAAELLADEVGLARLADWEQAARATTDCPGFGGPAIVGPQTAVQCGCADCACGCDSAPPPTELKAAMLAQGRWLDRLNGEGEPPAGPVRALAVLEPTTGGVQDWQFVPWPLSWPASDLVVADGGISVTQSAGMLIEDADEIAQLRALRAQARTFFPIVSDILVRESDSVWLRVYVRDELPEEFLAAVEAFRAGR